jgi:hypothetical protein
VEVRYGDTTGLVRRIVDGLLAVDRSLVMRERTRERFVDR